MKTRLLVSLASAGVLALACSQTGNPPATRLSGTHSVVASGSLLFITSTASNEIRVLDLQPPNVQTPVDYVRAPNPLSPLSIPTLSSPIDLATPTRYAPLGQPLTGDWLFARGAGSAAVSVIGALNCPQQLREFGQIVPRADAVVTAMASRLSSDDTLAYLYLATFDGQESTLWEAVLPNLTRVRLPISTSLMGNIIDAKTCPKYPSAMPPYVLRAIAPIPGAVVTSMAAIPTVWNPKDERNPAAGPLPEDKRLVVATRLLALPPNAPGTLSEEGVITVVDTTGAGSVGPDPLVFTPFVPPYDIAGRSFPVKKLVTHGNVVRVTLNSGQDAGFTGDGLGVFGGIAEVTMDAGTRVFGLLDEASCSGSQDCVGILAVDLDRPAAPGGFLPVAIDGEDNLLDFTNDAGVPIRGPDGGIIQFADTYYRPPAFFDGGVPRDANRMLPIRFGNGFGAGIFQDVVLQSSALVSNIDGTQLPYGLLGVASISGNGGSNIIAQIFVFDALSLRQINFTPAPPIINAQKSVLSDGAKAIFDGGPKDVVIGQGVWPYSENIFVLYEGIVAGVGFEPLDAGLGNPTGKDAGFATFPVSVNNRNAVAAYVRANDIIIPIDITNTECLYAFPILDNGDGGVFFDEPGGPYLHTRLEALGPSIADGGVLVLPDGGVPRIDDSCPPPFAYNIRSSGLSDAGQLTVSGTRSGFLGRASFPPPGGLSRFEVGENSTPSFHRFWRLSTDAGTPASPVSQPPVGFGFNLVERNGIPAVEPILTQGDVPELRGSGYEIDFVNGFAPGAVGIDQTTLNVGLLLPGSMTLYQRQVYPPLQVTVGADRVFVLYPGSNVILDFSPTTVTYTGLNSTDIGLHF